MSCAAISRIANARSTAAEVRSVRTTRNDATPISAAGITHSLTRYGSVNQTAPAGFLANDRRNNPRGDAFMFAQLQSPDCTTARYHEAYDSGPNTSSPSAK